MFDLQKTRTEIELKGFNSIYYFEFGKDFTHTPEKHNFWEMVYVDSGKVVSITNGIGCTLNQGDIIFHEPNEIHAHISNREIPNNMLVVSFTTDSENMNYFRKKTFTADKTSKTLLTLFLSEARLALRKIVSDYEDKRNLDFSNAEFGSTQLLSCYFTELLIHLIRTGENSGNNILQTAKSRIIAQNSITELVIGYMKDNIYTNLSLDDICRHFMIGKSKLCDIFRSTMGASIMEYYKSIKITEAKKLLRNEQYSVSQISDMLGYSCIHSFSRAFKSSVGYCPNEYKKSIF